MTPPDLPARLRRACADLDRRLRAGANARAEEVFAADPGLAADPDAAVELVYAEFAAREELGQRPDADAFLARFPALRDALADQFHVHALIRSEPPAGETGLPNAVGPYEPIEELSRGPGGRVFRARHRELGRVVALKLLPAAAARSVGEAWAAAKLEHPNIVRLYDVGTDPTGAYLALEWVSGGTLADRLAGKPLAPAAAAALVEPLARGVQHAHDREVVHRDIKPANVLLAGARSEDRGSSQVLSSLDPRSSLLAPKLSDFGLASTGGSSTAEWAGTPSYMAPEQARGKPDIGPAADVYALGAVLYECLTGRPPFRADTPLHTLEQVVSGEPVPPRRLNPRVPRDLETVCLTCLHKLPARRYPSAAALADDLRRFLDGRPVVARPVGPAERGWKWVRRRPAVAALLALLGVAGVALAAGGVWTNARLRAARDAAERDADAAREQRAEAEKQEAEARKQRLEAQRQEAYARVQEATVRRQFEAARRDVYTIQVSQANDLARTDPGRALSLLDDPGRCPPDLRDFAWGLLHRLCRQDVRTIPAPADVTGLAFSPDGKVLRANPPGHPLAWEIATGKPCEPFPWTPPEWTASKSGEGAWVARAGDPNRVRVPLGFTPGIVAVSPDGSRLAAADDTRRPRLGVWDVADGRELAGTEAGVHTLRVKALAWSPDGRRLASGGEDRTVRVWDADDLREVAALRGHIDTIKALAWTPDGRFVASAADDRTVRVWAADAPPGPTRTTGNDSKITAVGFSPDGRAVLATCADGGLKKWNLPPDGPPQVLATVPTRLLAMAVAADGRTAVGGEDGVVRVFDPDGCPIGEPARDRYFVRSLAWSADGRLLAVGWENGKVAVCAGDPLSPVPGSPPITQVRTVEFSPDGRTLAVAGPTGDVMLWDVASRRPVAARRCHEVPVLFARFQPGGSCLATGGRDYVVRLWDLPGLAERHALPGHSQYVFAAAFTPDGRSLATGSGNRFEDVPGEVKVWDVDTGHLRATLPGQTGPLAFDPAGTTLATVEDHSVVRLWCAD